MTGWRAARVGLFACITLVLAARASARQDAIASATQPTSRPAPVEFEVHEWVILVCDPFQSHASALKLVEATTLPQAVDTRRQRAPTTQQSNPCPVGVIRIVRLGADTAETVDVKIEVKDGRIVSNWPKGQTRASSVLWQDLRLSAEPARLMPLPAENWLGTLRNGTSAFLTAEERSERFLLYDVEVPYPLPLRLGGGRNPNDAVQLGNAGTVALHDVVLYRRDGATWRTAALAVLPPGVQQAPAATTRPATAPRDDLFEQAVPATTASTTQSAPATTAPAATQPLGVDPAFVEQVRMAPALATTPAEVLGEWKDRLTHAGLVTDDLDGITRILELHALDPKRLTAVYRLDDAELDRLIPLEVTPQPRRTVRVGLVIAKNIDPAVPAEIDELIARLGDRDWRVREHATESLATLGPAARPQLQVATKQPDPEIAVRAERLLARIEK